MFDWDDQKDARNVRKHGVSFAEAQRALLDPARVIARDRKHSAVKESRYFCFGLVDKRVLKVRFTMRANRIKIFGAGYWSERRRTV